MDSLECSMGGPVVYPGPPARRSSAYGQPMGERKYGWVMMVGLEI